MTRVAGLTYAKRGIRVNCVCPGTVNTPAIHAMGIPDVENFFAQAVPMGRLGTPEEIANGALWLCSDAARYVTGVVLPELGRASCRGRGCPYVEISGVAGSVNKQQYKRI